MAQMRVAESTRERIQNARAPGTSYDEKLRAILDHYEASVTVEVSPDD